MQCVCSGEVLTIVSEKLTSGQAHGGLPSRGQSSSPPSIISLKTIELSLMWDAVSASLAVGLPLD